MTNVSANWQETDEVTWPSAGEIHVWRFPLVVPPAQFAECYDQLAADERRRVDRFLFERHRGRFGVGRFRVRWLLAKYLETEPSQIEFAYTNLGKPSLETPNPDGALKFNFTNSADWGLLAVTTGDELGVDIELMRPMSDLEGLARRYFAESEIEAIASLAEPAAKTACFFRCWTRKEAFLKAVGKGLTFPLERVCVATAPENPVRICSIDGNEQAASSWSLVHLEPVPGYVGALAIAQRQVVVRQFMHLRHADGK